MRTLLINLIRNAVSAFIIFSVMLTACEVQFEPDVEPLIIGPTPDQQIPSEIGTEGGAEPVPGLTSSDALDLCGESLSWGDQSLGMCLAPGGDTYFAWINEDNVIRVVADASNLSQYIFQQAAQDRASSIADIESQGRSVIYEAGGFLIALVAAVPACATIVGCAIDGAALLVTGGLLAESGSSIVDSIDLGNAATKKANYSYCTMIGGSDVDCRKSAGITDELGED
jgi:hypothetical protein